MSELGYSQPLFTTAGVAAMVRFIFQGPHRFRLKAAELHVEIWRSKEASNRAEGRATQ